MLQILATRFTNGGEAQLMQRVHSVQLVSAVEAGNLQEVRRLVERAGVQREDHYVSID